MLRKWMPCLAAGALILLFALSLKEAEKNGAGGRLTSSLPIQITASKADTRELTRLVEQLLYTNVPELKAYKAWIHEKSRGQAFFIAEAGSGLEEICIDGTAAGRYYFVYVGEQWEDHRVNWDWFLVSESMDEVLWYDMIEGKYLTLDEWRASDSYRDWL